MDTASNFVIERRLIGEARCTGHSWPVTTPQSDHDAAQRGVRLQRRRVNASGLPLDQAGIGQSLQHPGEDRFVRLQVDQATRAEIVEWSGGASGNTNPR